MSVFKRNASLCISTLKFICTPVSTSRRFAAHTPLPLRDKKSKSKYVDAQRFVDKVTVRTVAGNGGNGCVGFESLWSNEHAGPSGGNGGCGGHVIFVCGNEHNNLNHCRPVLEARHGKDGRFKSCDGKNAEHLFVKVPVGTIVKNSEEKVIADLHTEGMMFIAARGGAGGRGNRFFASDTHQTPIIAECGGVGEKLTYTLEVKTLAHIGMLGFPNAGKSTLLRAISRARPRVAPHPFTTLQPHVGMILYDDYQQISVADMPGLIPGSHKNRGLGIKFLQHIERCRCLMYVIDLSAREPWEQLESLKYELSQYSADLIDHPQIIVANKIDLPEAEPNLLELKKRSNDLEIIPISAKMGSNLSNLLIRLRQIVDSYNK